MTPTGRARVAASDRLSSAAASLRSVVETFHRDLARAIEAVDVLRRAEHLDAELASVRADARAVVGRPATRRGRRAHPRAA
jgi:hypothetical protein